MHRIAVVALLGVAVLFGPLWSVAQTAEQRGLEIALEADRRDQGFGDFRADLVMLLRDRQGRESTRNMRVRVLEVEGDGDKNLILFDRPRDVKGTALLTYSHKQGADDQWIYLPALKRVKRISSAHRAGPFMGSEFAYEDIASQEVEKFRYRYLRDEDLEGRPCFVLERSPVSTDSGYTRQTVWLDQAEYRPLQIQYYDRSGRLLKTLLYTGYEQYLGKYWRAAEMSMSNHQTGKSTRLSWSGYEFRTGLGKRDFDRASLRRAR